MNAIRLTGADGRDMLLVPGAIIVAQPFKGSTIIPLGGGENWHIKESIGEVWRQCQASSGYVPLPVGDKKKKATA